LDESGTVMAKMEHKGYFGSAEVSVEDECLSGRRSPNLIGISGTPWQELGIRN
jgi:hypothetical protein